MAKTQAKYINLDADSLIDGGSGEVQVLVLPAGPIAIVAGGLTIEALGITDGMLAGSISFGKLADSANIARLDQAESIAAIWAFGSNLPTASINPSNANELARKAYVDGVAAGLFWKDPATAMRYIGNDSATNIDALSLGAGDAGAVYVVSTAGTVTGPGSVALGDVLEWSGVAWVRLVVGVGGFVADGVRLLVSTEGDTLQSPLSASTDEGKVADFDGTSLTPTLTTPSEGWAFLIVDDQSTRENNAYTFDGAVPTGTYIQFNGLANVDAGVGLNKSGNTIFVVPGDLITGGSAEIDGDKLDIDWTPTNYTPTTSPSEADSLDNLTAHLAGIDTALAGVGGTERKVDEFTLDGTDITNGYVTLSVAPAAAARVVVTVKNAPGQFRGDDWKIASGDRVDWNGDALDGVLVSGDKLTVEYDA